MGSAVPADWNPYERGSGIAEPLRINDARLGRPADLDHRRHVVGLDQLDADDVVRAGG